ncbi:hypothetical protein HDU76_002283, partial [Blyttiomyces sp. JEL0837]
MTGKKKDKTNSSGRNWGGSRPNTGRKKAVAAPDPSQPSLSTFFTQPSCPSSADPNIDLNPQQQSQQQQDLQSQQESSTCNDEGAKNNAGPSCDEVGVARDTGESTTTLDSTTPLTENEPNKSLSGDQDGSIVKTILDYVDISICESQELPVHLGVTNIIKPDGNCLFRSFGFLSNGNQEAHQIWRKKVVNYIRSHEDIFRDLIDNQENMTVKEYCDTMVKDGEYGDLYCIMAYVIMSRRPSTIYSKHGDSGFHVYRYNPRQNSAVIQTPIQLHLDTDSKHYEMLLPSNSFGNADSESVELNNVDCGDEIDGFDDDVNGDKEIDEADKVEDECNGDGPEKATGKKRKARREDRTTPIALYLHDLLEKLKKKELNERLQAGRLWIDPPEPCIAVRQGVLRSHVPTVGRVEVAIFEPGSIFLDVFMQCQIHIISTQQGMNAINPEELAFPALLTKRAGVDDDIVFRVRSSAAVGCGPTSVFNLIRQATTREYSRRELSYYSAVEYIIKQQVHQPRINAYNINNVHTDIPKFSTFKDENGYNGAYPSASYLTKIFVLEIENMRAYLDFEVQRRDGVYLKADHYFKISKHVTSINGQRLFRALFTAKNEYHEIRLQNFVQSASFDQIRQPLQDYRETREHLQQPELKALCVDDCCKSRAGYLSVLPELAKGQIITSPLPLPADVRLFSTSSPEPLRVALEPFIKESNEIVKDPSRKPLVVSLDTEFPTNSFKQKIGKVSLIQFAFTEVPFKWKDIVFLIQVSNSHPFPPFLSSFITSPATLKIGRRIKEVEVKYLHEDWDVTIDTAHVMDLGPLCKTVNITDDARNSLDKLTMKALGFSLPKDDSIRCSNWASGNLSAQQKEYAARDVWAGIKIYLAASRKSSQFSRQSINSVAETPPAGSDKDDLQQQPQDALEAESEKESKSEDDSQFVDAPEPHENQSRPTPTKRKSRSKTSQASKRQRNPAGAVLQRILLDVFHGLKRPEVSSLHPACLLFVRGLSQAIHEWDPTDVANVTAYLDKQPEKKTFHDKLREDWDWVLRRVRRRTRQPAAMAEAIQAVVDEFLKPSYNDNPPDIPMYFKDGVDKDGLNLYSSCRGTGDDESYHRLLEVVISCFNAGPFYICALLAYLRHCSNIGASERYRQNFPKIGHFDHFLIDQINEITLRIYGFRIHRWWPHSSLCLATSETFGITPCVPRDQYENFASDDIKDYPTVYKAIAQKTKVKVPYLPIHTKEEFALFWRNVSFYTGSKLGDRSKPKDGFQAAKMCSDWNCGNLPMDRGKIPSVDMRIFRKLEEHIENGYKLYLKALARREIMFKNDQTLKAMNAALAALTPADIDLFLPPRIPTELGPFFFGSENFEDNLAPSNLLTTTSTESPAASIAQDTEDDFDMSIVDTEVEHPFPRSASDSVLIAKPLTSYLRPAVVPLAQGLTTSPTAAPIRPFSQRQPRRPRTCKHPNCPKRGTGEKCPGSQGGITKCLVNSLQASTLPAIVPSTLPVITPLTPPAVAPSNPLTTAPSIPPAVVLRVSQPVNQSEQFNNVWEPFNARMVGVYGVGDAIVWSEESERHLVEARQNV